MSENIIKKLSIKTLIGAMKKPPEGETVTLCRFAGIAKATKTGESNFGPWTALVGDFAGINLETGEVTRSPVLFAPEIMMQMILPEVEAGNTVDFVFDITATGDKTVAVGYRYGLKTVRAPSENDPLKALLATIPALEDKTQKTGSKSKAK